jgi:hypothetical protein
MKEKLMSGTTKECLADFFKRFGKNEVFEEFVGAAYKAEARWRLQGLLPVGMYLIRVQHFLGLIGYQVKELQVPRPFFLLGQCFACKIVDVEALGKELNIKVTRLYEYIWGGVTPTEGRMNQISQVVAKNGLALMTYLSEHSAVHKSFFESDSVVIELEEIKNDSVNNATDSILIADFGAVCELVREIGQKLLDGPVGLRDAMRLQMGQGSNPPLHLTWEVLNKLLYERMEKKA